MAGLALLLADAGATLTLGRRLAAGLAPMDLPQGLALLLEGDLGAGKTTLARGLVAALPGGNQAEVASPSFNLCNLYPTMPPTAHADLYRLEGAPPDEGLLELFSQPQALVIVEWAQYLPTTLRPADHVLGRFEVLPEGRRLTLAALGSAAQVLLAVLAKDPELSGLIVDAQPCYGEPLPMDIVVLKFGGTSVAGLERMRRVLEIVKNERAAGHKVAVVLSAMSGETNRLLAQAADFAKEPDPAELDVLLTTGEQASVALFAMLCKEAGLSARSLLGHQISIDTSCEYGRARILNIDAERLRGYFVDHDVLVVAGFQGCDDKGRLTTLGRGGSDTSAVALAAALGAKVCDIYTDVPGVFTTDPNICREARKLGRISYDEMLEMASQGAKVLQIRSVEFAKKYNVTVHVRSTFSNEPGTIVTQEDAHMEAVLVSGVALDRNQCRVTVYDVLDQPGVAHSIFGPLAQAGVIVDMIIQNTSRDGQTDMTFTIAKNDLKPALGVLQAVKDKIGAKEIQHDDGVCKVSVIGVGMRNHAGVAARAFEALAQDNVNILMISTSEIKITILIEDRYAELAVRCLHEAFELDKDPAQRTNNEL